MILKVKNLLKDMRENWEVLAGSFIVVYFTAFVGSLFTDIGNWYESVRPAITPPNYVFPVVWNILFFMIALSLFFAYISGKKRKLVVLVYGINLVLNGFWSYLFFGLQKPGLAFYGLIALWFSILWMIFVVWRIDKKFVWLLVPYLLWVGFAGYLNYLIAF